MVTKHYDKSVLKIIKFNAERIIKNEPLFIPTNFYYLILGPSPYDYSLWEYCEKFGELYKLDIKVTWEIYASHLGVMSNNLVIKREEN